MGHIVVDAKVHGTRGEIALPGLLIDTGATYTVLPREALDEVGAIKVPGKIKIELGDGRAQEADVYAVRIEIAGREGPAFAITFEGAKSVIGIQTLESLGLKVNPVKEVLEPTRPKGLAYFYKA